MSITYKTNNTWRKLVTFLELPRKVQSDFDYVSEECRIMARFVKYRGSWYDAIDTMRIEGQLQNELPGYEAYITETYFSGLAFKFNRDCDSVICATFYSKGEE